MYLSILCSLSRSVTFMFFVLKTNPVSFDDNSSSFTSYFTLSFCCKGKLILYVLLNERLRGRQGGRRFCKQLSESE